MAAPRDAGGAIPRPGQPHQLRQDPSEAPDRRFDSLLAALVQAREEGLIDGIGLSNISRQQLPRAVAQTEIVCVQNLFNLADQRSWTS